MYRQLAVVVSSPSSPRSSWRSRSSRSSRRSSSRSVGRGSRPLARLYDWSGGLLDGLEGRYQEGLRWALRHPRKVLGGATLLLLASSALVPFIGVRADADDRRRGSPDQRGDGDGTKLELMDATMRQIERIARENVPEVQNILTSVGGGGGWSGGGGNRGDVRITLVPRSERNRCPRRSPRLCGRTCRDCRGRRCARARGRASSLPGSPSAE